MSSWSSSISSPTSGWGKQSTVFPSSLSPGPSSPSQKGEVIDVFLPPSLTTPSPSQTSFTLFSPTNLSPMSPVPSTPVSPVAKPFSSVVSPSRSSPSTSMWQAPSSPVVSPSSPSSPVASPLSPKNVSFSSMPTSMWQAPSSPVVSPSSPKTPMPTSMWQVPVQVPSPKSPVVSHSPRVSPKSPVVSPKTPTTPTTPSYTSLSPKSKLRTNVEYLQQNPSISFNPNQPFTPTEITIGSFKSEFLTKFENEMNRIKDTISPYYKQIKTNKCSDIGHLDIVKINLLNFVQLYNKNDLFNSNIHSNDELSESIKILGRYIEIINKVLEAMKICYDKFISDLNIFTQKLKEVKDPKPANYYEMVKQAQQSNFALTQIAEASTKISQKKVLMTDDLKKLNIRNTQYKLSKVSTPRSSSPTIFMPSTPVMRESDFLIGHSDTQFLFNAVKNRPKLAAKIDGIIKIKDRNSLLAIVNALKLEQYSKKIKELGYQNEGAAVMGYLATASNVEIAKDLYLRLSERKDIMAKLSKYGITEEQAKSATNQQLLTFLNQKMLEKSGVISPAVDPRVIAQKKKELEQSYIGLDDATLYSLTSGIVGKQFADNAWNSFNKREKMIEAIVSKQLNLF